MSRSTRIIVIILLIALLVAAPVAGAFYVWVRNARQAAQASTCQSSVCEVRLAMQLYMEDSHGRFPDTAKWYDLIHPYMGEDWSDWCPAASGKHPTYAVNAKLKGLSIKEVKDPAHTVMLFESVEGRNLAGGPELFPDPPRHPQGYSVAFVSGRVSMVSLKQAAKLKWDPR